MILVLAGCVGAIGDAGGTERGGGSDGPSETAYEGATCVEGSLPDADLARVNREFYISALRQAFGDEVIEAVAPAVSAVPRTQNGRYGSELEAPSLAVVTAYLDLATAVAFEATADLGALSPCLTSLGAGVDPMTDACLRDLVDDLGRQLTRRPLPADDRDRFLSAYAIGGAHGVADGVATLLMEMLLDPRFLYFVEIDGEPADGVASLTSHELAARVARVLWGTAPDEELMAAADAGLEGERLVTQVQRMWEDERARHGMRRFFSEWLELPGDDPAVEGELITFVERLTFDREATYGDLLLDNTAFVESEEVATLYGFDPSFRGEVALPAERRAGILTRAGWLSTYAVPNTNAGHIIHRGNRLARFVCNALPPPDPGLLPADDPAEVDGATIGIRQRFLEVTAEPQCAHCHERIDAFGAPFGHFGAAGEWIDVETIEREGASPLTLEIDTTATLTLGEETLEIDSAVELSRAIADNDEAARCMAEHLARNALGRELRGGDACFVDRAVDVLVSPDAEPRSVREAILTLVTSQEFSTRRYAEGD
jgi:hypothetical protein